MAKSPANMCRCCGQPLTRLQDVAYPFWHDRSRWAVRTGEMRAPRKDELYLSGAIPEVYVAPNDLSTPFHILREVSHA